MFDRLSEDQRQVLNIVREGHNIFITGQGGTARKNNCLLSSIFPAGEGEICPEMHALAIMAEMAINCQTINKNSNDMAHGPFGKWRFRRKWQKWQLIAKL